MATEPDASGTAAPAARGASARRPLERVRGTQDNWPSDACQLDAVRRRLEAVFETYGYARMDVPVLEPAELHLRKSGLEIIAKLYAFDDLGGRRLCLRPELTASVVRALIAQPVPRLPAKVYASGPVFRYERPARGRYRQFTQCGVELVGATGPVADAEVVTLAMDALDQLGLTDYRVTIGHVGILADLLTKLGLTGRLRSQLLDGLEAARRHGVAAVREQLQDLDPDLFAPEEPGTARWPAGHAGQNGWPAGHAGGAADGGEARLRASLAGLLTQLGPERLGRRTQDEIVDRLLHKLQRPSQRLAVERALEFIAELGRTRGAPDEALAAGRDLLRSFGLGDEALRDLERVVSIAGEFGAGAGRLYLDLGLSRGLQYYTGMVFEIDHAGLGSESQLCGGGRYDDLFRALGARQPVPALGFAFGVERVKLALEVESRPVATRSPDAVYVIAVAPALTGYAGRVAQQLRRAGRTADLDVTGRSLRASLAYAHREGYTQVALLGEEEARDGSVRLRDMADGREETVSLADLFRAAGRGSRGSGPPPATPSEGGGER